jgi:3-hydroxybutyryl-CoA dehydrogenase
MGKTPIEAKGFPGFIPSRLSFSFMNEGIFALYEGLGEKEEIDAIMKMGANHPMGPIELAGLVGLDTVLPSCMCCRRPLGTNIGPARFFSNTWGPGI